MFAPVYRPSEGQTTFLTRQQKSECKRKRDQEGSDSESGDELLAVKQSPDPDDAQTSASALHPVRKTDPYHVSGHPREAPLPPAPFPHTAVRDSKSQRKPVEEELAALNPPIYVSEWSPEDRSTSSKRRHIENLTTLLHTCMLRGDWQRASRAWGLLLRTETAGRGMDVRQHGRWSIGAELLMRRQQVPARGKPHPSSTGTDQSQERNADPVTDHDRPAFTDEGFRLARQYYERLILQYPHTPWTQHAANALALYPALFNIWIYEVQDRSKRARQGPAGDRPASPTGSERSADVSTASDTHSSTAAAKKQELNEALPIAQSMDELMLSPPYDTSLPLLQLRGMLGLWLADLYGSRAQSPPSSDDEGVHQRLDRGEAVRSRELARLERGKAREVGLKLRASGAELPAVIAHLLDNES
ncbi:hypothetical protein LTR36_010075 [Oleoguttula mirabilis]|uniref:Uncharacterized protein n=1 Tax=Oleoguttula mirabilis TaxID=1507867 RepID=A0AAV9JRE4_9PEZI|nr:hypothetical protein LTR36_010075 [Oleoguttula mirabilis]